MLDDIELDRRLRLGLEALAFDDATEVQRQVVPRALTGADLKVSAETGSGKTLAFAHARSGDAMMIRGYIGEDTTFDDVMVEYADRYADISRRDQAQLCEAIDAGAIEVVRDI